MASRDIRHCTPWLRERWMLMEQRGKEIGLIICLSCTSRRWDEQRALYAQGREGLDMVNHLRANTGMSPITEKDNLRKVTWTLDSKHVVNDARPLSEAFDVYIMHQGKAVWDLKADVNKDNISDYSEVVQIGRGLGLRCGADFKPNPDIPHFEMP